MTIQLSQLPGQERPINQDVFALISDLVWAALENDPEYIGMTTDFDEAFGELAKKFPVKGSVLTAIEDAPMELAVRYGGIMFRLGLELGRNPSVLLWLPDGSYMRGENHHA